VSGLQIARSFRGALTLSVALGMLCVVAGLYASFVVDVATGPAIALASTAVFVLVIGARGLAGARRARA
jgi:ABC-type Mn2+/Zn2+ transport system permease subunit